MKSARRVLTTLATTVLLTAGGAALAAPAHADVHAHLLGVVGAEMSGVIELTGPVVGSILTIPNPLPDVA
ncbi:hypothetical protein ABZ951_08545 [Streptomyces sp. NPDC046215]|uniref:Chaplin domain-containing protein n=1 Tax=Streptomyces stramineus TaxID=173861 RepID=A0ABN0ZLC1_9ACTN